MIRGYGCDVRVIFRVVCVNVRGMLDQCNAVIVTGWYFPRIHRIVKFLQITYVQLCTSLYRADSESCIRSFKKYLYPWYSNIFVFRADFFGISILIIEKSFH